MASHFKGPILGARTAADGLYEGLPLAAIDSVRSGYQVWTEEFKEEFLTGQLITMGAHVDDLNTATAPTQVVTSETGYLLINPGTKADAGSSCVFDIAPTAASTQNAFTSPRALTSTTTLMTGKELTWATRIGFISDTAASWDGKAIFGWLAADTTPMVDATGVPSMATGCGAGFHIGETGVISYFAQQAALTTVPTTTAVSSIITTGAAIAAGVPKWYDLGFRIKWLDASAGTGRADFFVNSRLVGTITTGLPMSSTEIYASTYAVQNGGSTPLVDLAVDYMTVAITRA